MTNEKNSGAEPIVLGALDGAYGLKGWVSVQPFQGTSALLGSKHWQHVLPDGEVRPVELEKAKLHGAGIVAKIQGIDTPEDAAALRGAVALYRKDFPEAQENEYYWVDLIGCDVVNKEGQSIGRVKGMIDNGVHDILNVKRADGKEVLIPFVEDYLAEVNVETKKIIVDWDPSWD